MSTLNESNLEPPPEQLCRIDGMAGILLQQQGRILISDFPLHSSETERVADLARRMCLGFQNARRVLRQVIIGYPCGHLIVVSRDDTQLILLLLDDAALDSACKAAAAYLARRLHRPLRLPTKPMS
jgi:hypothetical protein